MRMRQLEEEIREEEEKSRIELEELDEETRRKIMEAKLKETELEDALSDACQDHSGIGFSDVPCNNVSRTRDWVDNTEVNPVAPNFAEHQHLNPNSIMLEEPQSSNDNNTPHSNNDAFAGYAVYPNRCTSAQHIPFPASPMNLNLTNPTQHITSSRAQAPMMNPYAQPLQPRPLTYTSASTGAAATRAALYPLLHLQVFRKVLCGYQAPHQREVTQM